MQPNFCEGKLPLFGSNFEQTKSLYMNPCVSRLYPGLSKPVQHTILTHPGSDKSISPQKYTCKGRFFQCYFYGFCCYMIQIHIIHICITFDADRLPYQLNKVKVVILLTLQRDPPQKGISIKNLAQRNQEFLKLEHKSTKHRVICLVLIVMSTFYKSFAPSGCTFHLVLYNQCQQYYYFFKRFCFACSLFYGPRCSEKLQDIYYFVFIVCLYYRSSCKARGRLVTCCEIHLGASLKISQ